MSAPRHGNLIRLVPRSQFTQDLRVEGVPNRPGIWMVLTAGFPGVQAGDRTCLAHCTFRRNQMAFNGAHQTYGVDLRRRRRPGNRMRPANADLIWSAPKHNIAKIAILCARPRRTGLSAPAQCQTRRVDLQPSRGNLPVLR